MSEMLPTQILRMVIELHNRGYESLYLYSGMSPSGMNWRYEIGIMSNGEWPSRPPLTQDSLDRASQDTPWSRAPHSVTELADRFETTFQSRLDEARVPNKEYAQWFHALVNTLRPDQLLDFYADYDTDFERVLKSAPGYSRNRR
jgi:hypothetical protein